LFELVLRIGFSLLIVFGLMWGLARVIRRPLGGNRGPGHLSVLHRTQLGRGSAVAVVQVADKALVLGVTDQQVSLLGETELAAFEKEHGHHHEHRDPIGLAPDQLEGSVLSPRVWRSTMDFLRDRTTRQ
jgi:flagellar protein FliO/FliZ